MWITWSGNGFELHLTPVVARPCDTCAIRLYEAPNQRIENAEALKYPKCEVKIAFKQRNLCRYAKVTI